MDDFHIDLNENTIILHNVVVPGISFFPKQPLFKFGEWENSFFKKNTLIILIERLEIFSSDVLLYQKKKKSRWCI